MYFIFKHVEFSRYQDRKGKFYHYDEKSPNFNKVKKGAKVLLYQKESNEIFARANIRKIKEVVRAGRRNFFASYGDYVKFKKPLELTFDVRKKLGLRNLELPSPGIIPIDKRIYQTIIQMENMYKTEN